MPRTVRFEKPCNVWDLRFIGIGVRQVGADEKQNLVNSPHRTPLILEDIKTDSSVGVDVAVVDPGGKLDLGRHKWIIGRKVNIEKENAARIGGIVRSLNCSLPVEHVISDGSCGAISRGVLTQPNEF
jgi:hypothetical protein